MTVNSGEKCRVVLKDGETFTGAFVGVFTWEFRKERLQELRVIVDGDVRRLPMRDVERCTKEP